MKRLEWLQILKGLCIIVSLVPAGNIAIVSKSVAEDPNVSIPRHFQELGLPYGTLWRILHLDLHPYPYKVSQLTDYNIVEPWNRCLNNVTFGNFSNKILFSKETHFTLGGYVSK